MKKVDIKDVTPGLECVVNDLVDTTIYRVTQVNGRNVKLDYLAENSGEMVNGGESEVSLLYYPSKEQLAHSSNLMRQHKPNWKQRI